MHNSDLVPVGTAVLLEDKEGESDLIKVQLLEQLTDIEGDLTSFEETHGDIKSTNAITAIWLDFSDIRYTAPNMVKGEKVFILRFRGTESYFWHSIGRSNDLRKLEHILWGLSNTKEIAEKPKEDNQLFLTASTRDGYIELITPDNRKEKAKYKIKINFKEGIIEVEDNHDNKYTLNSVKRHMEWKTKTATFDLESMLIKGDVTMEKTLTVYKKALFKSNVIGKSSAKFSGSVKGTAGIFPSTKPYS